MGRQSRRKRERKQAESRESRAFREAMDAEIASDPLQGLGFDPAAVDWDTLMRIAKYVGTVLVDRKRAGADVLDSVGRPSGKLPVIEPTGTHATHEEFDRMVCATGVRKFVRPIMDNEWQLTPDIPIFGMPDHVLVIELSRGVRRRCGFNLHWSEAPGPPVRRR
jgi:hypothetical protein